MNEEEIIEPVPTEAIIPDEELDFELEDTEDVEALKAQIEKDAVAKRQLAARAKKAEDENRTLKKAPVTAPATQSAQSIEETVLLANGMDESLMESLKKVAAVQGTSLIKAQNDPIFIAMKEGFEKDKAQKASSMPASRGSGQQKPKKDFRTPGLTEAEHKAMHEGLNF